MLISGMPKYRLLTAILDRPLVVNIVIFIATSTLISIGMFLSYSLPPLRDISWSMAYREMDSYPFVTYSMTMAAVSMALVYISFFYSDTINHARTESYTLSWLLSFALPMFFKMPDRTLDNEAGFLLAVISFFGGTAFTFWYADAYKKAHAFEQTPTDEYREKVETDIKNFLSMKEHHGEKDGGR